jgi:hypothetical protein
MPVHVHGPWALNQRDFRSHRLFCWFSLHSAGWADEPVARGSGSASGQSPVAVPGTPHNPMPYDTLGEVSHFLC